MRADFLLTGIGQLVTCDPALGEGPLGVVERAAVAAAGGRVVFAGPQAALGDLDVAAGAVRVDAGGQAVLPGFVDAHTHLVFAGDRADEFAARLRGVGYEEALAAGGGINRTVRETRAASDAELEAAADRRLALAARHGTTTLEAKSGYGLTVEDERRSLEVLARVAARSPVEVVPTFLGAHLVPEEYAGDRAGYLDLLEHEMLPACAPLAEFVDAFCDRGALTVEESRRVLAAGARHGLRGKLHANELGSTGGAALAAELGCVSADHLLYCEPEEARALAAAGTVAVLLPGTSFLLRTGRAAPVQVLRDAGVTMALGTDCNPGTCYCESMQLVIALACVHDGLTPEEAVLAATDGAARALGRGGRVGRLAPGAACDLVVLAGRSYLDLAYHLGVNLARLVVKGGVLPPGDGDGIPAEPAEPAGAGP
ncbi:MAG TPA: imidazolonepropionase [Actinomycetes bacterium]|nr:imidazolonepropionase [Actinomycetes bacterium]